MNYIQQIRAFDDFKLYKARLSSGEIALWHALMSINNKTGWQEWFTAANSMIVSLSGLSRSGILKDRNVLKQIGLIDFRTNGKKATSYHVCILYTSDSVQDSKHQSKQNSKHSSKQDSNTLYKLNQTETNQYTDNAREEFTLKIWPEFPKRQKFTEAFDAYLTARQQGATDEQIIDGLKRYSKYLKVKHKGDGFTAMPANWLNDKRWTDKYDLTPEQPGPKGKDKRPPISVAPNDSFKDSDIPF